ncbi:MAG TPA: SAM-dependent methyltransferase [Pseudonocardiaceae bacterium]|nr:SAM-dependent methyltransferase [Pseudonocardiaceae bacterium]
MARYNDWTSPEIDTKTPSAARLYDYYLGGAHHFEADRELGRQVLEALPDLPFMAQRNRMFVIRAVRMLVGHGFTQFVDVGCGLPATGAVHEVVQQVNPDSRVIYVDNEPVAIAHGELMLADVPGTGVVGGDLREPESFLDHPTTRELLDFTKPIVVVAAAVMHFVTDQENPAGVMTKIRHALPAGSLVVFSHGTAGDDAVGSRAVVDLYEQSSNHAVPRTTAQVAALLAGYQLLGSGVTWVTEICPEEGEPTDDGPRSHMLGAVAAVPDGADTPEMAELSKRLASAGK